jgi:hypothetical protein
VKARNREDIIVGSTSSSPSGQYELSGLPPGDYSIDVENAGFQAATVSRVLVSAGSTRRQDITLLVGGIAETMQVTSEVPLIATSESSLPAAGRTGSGRTLGREPGASRSPGASLSDSSKSIPLAAYALASQPVASGQEVGDLFEYKIAEPVTLLRNQSALVPITQANLEIEQVTLWNPVSGLRRPLRALWLNNSTGQPLDSGAFSVMHDGAFAGEGMLDPIKPGEKRLVSYAVDHAVQPAMRESPQPTKLVRVSATRNTVSMETQVRLARTYSFRNEDAAPRVVVLEHPVRPGFSLVGGAAPDETTPNWARFRIVVPAKDTRSLTVEEATPSVQTYQVRSVTAEEIARFVSLGGIGKEFQTALTSVVEQRTIVANLEGELERLSEEKQSLYDDQQRLRENMKALRGSAEEKSLLQRYTRQLDEQETRLGAIEKQTARLEADKAGAERELDRRIAAVQFAN